MNLSKLRQNVGQQVHLYPHPIHVHGNGTEDTIDVLWKVKAVGGTPLHIALVATDGGWSVDLRPDNIREWRSPHWLVLRCQLFVRNGIVEVEPRIGTPDTLPCRRNPDGTYSYTISALGFSTEVDSFVRRVKEELGVSPCAITSGGPTKQKGVSFSAYHGPIPPVHLKQLSDTLLITTAPPSSDPPPE